MDRDPDALHAGASSGAPVSRYAACSRPVYAVPYIDSETLRRLRSLAAAQTRRAYEKRRDALYAEMIDHLLSGRSVESFFRQAGAAAVVN